MFSWLSIVKQWPLTGPGVDQFVNAQYQVDMTEQIQLGNFIPPGDTIRVTGAPSGLTSWGAGVDMTNNPSLSGTPHLWVSRRPN